MNRRSNRPRGVIKRVVDLTLTIPLLIALVPVFLVLGIAIKLESAGPVFFRQRRLGFRGREFRIYKFRTMVDAAEHNPSGGFLHVDDPRITRSGKVLRKYRLDELPQLINVLKGEMSLVGPRPLLPEYLDSYSKEDRRRMDVPPGITGWQQVHGAATNTWEQRVSLDLWYVDHHNVLIDFYTMFRTIIVVLKADTVYGKDGFQRSGVPTHSSIGKAESELPHDLGEEDRL
jgi:sugar transferase EpsL